jgi:hypothetical protein
MCGRPTSSTPRWRVAFCIWWRSSIGLAGRFWPGDCRTRWIRAFASPRWRRLRFDTANRKYSTPIRDASSSAPHSPASLQRRAAPFQWTDAAVSWTIFSSNACGARSNLIKYEEVHRKAYADGREARAGIGARMSFYNHLRSHQAMSTVRQSHGTDLIQISPTIVCLLTMIFHAAIWSAAAGVWHVRPSSALTLAGALSYPIYLLHNEIGIVLFNATDEDRWLTLVAISALVIVASWAVCSFVESPVRRLLNRAPSSLAQQAQIF